jgi:4-carboxymuconolactone decarboxylase
VDDLFEKGRKVRTEVLGAEHVERSMSSVTPFNAPLLEFGTRYCWGDIWSREGLDRRTRSLVNLAMLVALDKPNELRLHINGALNNGCTTVEIQEVLLQTAIYAGLPAAVEAFKIAGEVLESRTEAP